MGVFGLPIIEGLCDLALSWIEVAKITPIKKTLYGNKEITDLQGETEYQGETVVEGFKYYPEPDDDEWEDDEE